jgi:hypothetical protein
MVLRREVEFAARPYSEKITDKIAVFQDTWRLLFNANEGCERDSEETKHGEHLYQNAEDGRYVIDSKAGQSFGEAQGSITATNDGLPENLKARSPTPFVRANPLNLVLKCALDAHQLARGAQQISKTAQDVCRKNDSSCVRRHFR